LLRAVFDILIPTSAVLERQASQGGKQRTQLQMFSLRFKNILS